MTEGTLAGKCVVLGVTGSIAAVEVVHLVHCLRREGAIVQAVMSPAAQEIVTPDTLAYATQREAITRCTGLVEHVRYCGEGGEGDVFLIAPCTANTIGKIAAGIDDTPVTTFATTAIGRGMPILVAPAMHESMYRHPQVAANLERLRSWGVEVIPPRCEEERAKIADLETIVLYTERAAEGRPLAGRKVLIASGPCIEPVDDVRILTTRSSGRMGWELAREAFRLGAEVTVVHGQAFPCVRNVFASSAAEMREAVHRLFQSETFDYYLSPAAISDFAPVRVPGKIPSGRPLDIHLEPLPKLLAGVLERYHPNVVAFKLAGERAQAEAMLSAGVRMVVLDTPEAMGTSTGTFMLLTEDGEERIEGSKEEVARRIWHGLQ
ncbi:MAG: bifunctional phosphopantothenoylcysteine decarboxylase/phosphopantothenate--cysteine ligase CoaBC [Methanomicrobiales archaeon]|nr:bifunctional phosphopantothenoylcysteine decarboxylase/phosphopantothenate--cysteine ligase CoaBC [Methanomicrobiales archaeon]